MITQERLKELLCYDSESGVFTRKAPRQGFHVGQVAGRARWDGYVMIGADRRTYYAHRLAWLHYYGSLPMHEIDHINGDRGDNRISNIREATKSQNAANTKCRRDGLKGAFYIGGKRRKRWMSKLMKNNEVLHLGYHDTEQDAHKAYVAAAKQHHGEFARAS